MSEIDLDSIHGKLRVEGLRSHRAPFIVGKIRRVLWPFIRSYHLITLAWVRDVVLNLRAEILSACRDVVSDLRAEFLSITSANHEQIINEARTTSKRLRALNAEVLAIGRENAEIRAVLETKDAEIRAALETKDAEIRAALEAKDAEKRAVLEARDAEIRAVLEGQKSQLNELVNRFDNTPQAGEFKDSRVDSLLISLQQADFRLTQMEGVTAGQGQGWSADLVHEGQFGVAFPIGNAVCCRSAFGPIIMKQGDLITRELIKHGGWDTHLLIWLKAGAKRGSVAVDAGAHFGTLSCAMAVHFSTVHAFEPNLANYVYLCANAALRPVGRIIPHNVGLYSEQTEISLAQPEQQEVTLEAAMSLEQAFREVENTGGLVFSPQGTGVNTIKAVTLDSLNLQDVGFIKVDCQGSDGPVIAGAMETIRRCRPIVVFEWEKHLSCHQSITLEAVQAMLESVGYRVQVALRHNEKQADYVAIPQD
ncbi:FkbM family methyltransferase [Paraburkholderia sp. A2RI-6]|uniref:FkbM family methyltransferase n=1 Tax=Paraburkholderia sp. A2RI-6 TaxID=3028371 RepID=UPI003B7D1D88